jgi:UDP-GlcNAc:undecaprenyl-phosphate/decaprenyl-phosphate GlcNAc-1-phosphate transferase
MGNYLLWITILAFFIPAAISAILTPASIWFGKKHGIVDKADEFTPSGQKKITKKITPRTGGLGIFFAVFIPFLFLTGFEPGSLYVLIGAIIIVVFMLIDDKYKLSPWIKFAGQILAATPPILAGYRIAYLTNVVSSGWFSVGWLAIPLTYLWIILVVNAVNFIDGLDGLASGITVIVCITSAIVSLSVGLYAPALLLICLAGASAGFLPFNFEPAKIYLGDNGSHFIGYLIAVSAIWGTAKATTAVVLGVSFLALFIPMADVFYSALRRIKNKKSPFKGDMDNLHYQLIKKGWSVRSVVLVFYTITAIFSALALYVFVIR